MSKLFNWRHGLASENFFRLIMAGLVLQALWIALSGRYPMAFDENFHLGIIHIYSHHLSPFLSSQPAGADAFGAVARDPSYLYQYLMSFPDRLIHLFTSNQTAEVLILRFINIGLFASALPLFRRLLLKTGASRVLVHACLLIFVLIPIVPLLAAQINYDNLMMPLVAGFLLLALRLDDELRRKKSLNMQNLILILIIGLLGSLVKYPFLPIFAAVIIFSLFQLYRVYPSWSNFRASLVSGFSTLTVPMRWFALIGLVIASVLFAQRDGVNLVRYHTPVPACDRVLSVQECKTYGPWARNYTYANIKTATTSSPVVFARKWVGGMWLRTIFAVDGPNTDFQTRGPLLLPAQITVIAPLVAVLAVALYGRRLWRKYKHGPLGLLSLTAILYVAALWIDNYLDFVNTGQPVAINGRYLVPLLLPMLVIGGLAIKEAFQNRPQLKIAFLGITTLCLIWGGGALTYLLRDNDAWLWPSQAVRDADHAVQRVLGPITPGYQKPIEFL